MGDQEWQLECAYISNTTDKFIDAARADRIADVREMNCCVRTFISYCEMQRNAAAAAGRHDTATYIEHCIDDLGDPDAHPR